METTLLTIVVLTIAQVSGGETPIGLNGKPQLADPNAGRQPLRVVDDQGTESQSQPQSNAFAEPRRLVPVIRAERPDSVASLLRTALQFSKDRALGGRPASLLSVVSITQDRSRQTEIVRTYWELSAAVANVHFADEALNRLQQLDMTGTSEKGTSEGDAAEAQLRAALADARVWVEESLLQAVRSQHSLAEIADPAVLLLPADIPHTGRYRTYFDELFAGKTASTARRLHALLPIRHKVVTAKAEAVHASTDLLKQMTRDFATEGVTLSRVLAQHEKLVERQTDFILAVRDYNQQIVQYARTAASERIDAERFVNMLIKTNARPVAARPLSRASSDGLTSVMKGRGAADADRSAVVPATAEEAIESPAQPGRSTRSRDDFVRRRSDR